jgi:hypothetical protein
MWGKVEDVVPFLLSLPTPALRAQLISMNPWSFSSFSYIEPITPFLDVLPIPEYPILISGIRIP